MEKISVLYKKMIQNKKRCFKKAPFLILLETLTLISQFPSISFGSFCDYITKPYVKHSRYNIK